MIIDPKKTDNGVKTQISNIWTGVPNIRSTPACLHTRAVEHNESPHHVRPASRTARHLPELHAQLLDVVRAFLEPQKRKHRPRAPNHIEDKLIENSEWKSERYREKSLLQRSL